MAGGRSPQVHRPRPRRSATLRPFGIRLRLLDGFDLISENRPVPLPHSAQRVAAFLALQERRLPRSFVAGTLWIDAPQERAGANLRSALWRLRRPGHLVVEVSNTHLCLAPGVVVDIREMASSARQLVDRKVECNLERLSVAPLAGDLLPGWYDEWVVVERERLHQLRLHALEALCERLTAVGRFGRAVEAGLAAVAVEPLRESAHRVLIRAYLAEGNRTEAIRHYRMYRRLLQDELGLGPSPRIVGLVRGLPVG